MVYVVDSKNCRVQKFTPNGQFVLMWGSRGTGDGQFQTGDWGYGPRGIAVGPQGYIYVADRYNHRIQKFAADGKFACKWGSYGSGAEQFNEPMGLAVDKYDYVVVADSRNYRTEVFESAG